MQPLTILKLGGSAITDKGRECTPDIPTIQSLADQLRDYDLPLILIHGGGSYAHPFVAESGLGKGLRDRSQLRFISETEFYLGQLTRIICASLLLRGKLPVPFHPMSFVTFDNGKVKRVMLDPIRKALQSRLIPLLHGDLASDKSGGIVLISGYRIASLGGRCCADSRRTERFPFASLRSFSAISLQSFSAGVSITSRLARIIIACDTFSDLKMARISDFLLRGRYLRAVNIAAFPSLCSMMSLPICFPVSCPHMSSTSSII